MIRKFIKVSIGGVNTPKGMRKPRKYRLELGELPQNAKIEDHLIELTQKAKDLLSRMSKVETATIYCNNATIDDYEGQHSSMIFVELLSIKTFKII